MLPETVPQFQEERPSEEGLDGPLLLGLMLANLNNNTQAQKIPGGGSDSQGQPIPDTLQVERRVYEMPSSAYLRGGAKFNANTLHSAACREDDNAAEIIRNPVDLAKVADQQIQSYRDNGYLVIRKAMRPEMILALLQCVREVADGMTDGSESGQEKIPRSGEEGVLSPNGRVMASLRQYPKHNPPAPLERITRLGTGLHRALHPFRAAVFTPLHRRLAELLGLSDPRVTQSLVINKSPGVGEPVRPHQDGCSNFTSPPSCATFWYALEDATAENGCLSVAPGSHRTEPISRRCVRGVTGKPEFVDVNPAVFASVEGSGDAALPRRDLNEIMVYEDVEAEAGDLVVMHGGLMHRSGANRSSKSRMAFNFSVVEGSLPWPEDAYLQPYDGEDEFEKL